MDGVSWIDLDPDEQRAIALLGAGVSVELCDRVALLTLARLGLVSGGQLTPQQINCGEPPFCTNWGVSGSASYAGPLLLIGTLFLTPRLACLAFSQIANFSASDFVSPTIAATELEFLTA